MSTPFTATLRTGDRSLRIGTAGDATITFRVQVTEIWETIRVDAPSDTPVATVKERVISTLMPDEQYPEDYLVKIAGWEVLDENASIASAGVVPGSILLIGGRRRRPVR